MHTADPALLRLIGHLRRHLAHKDTAQLHQIGELLAWAEGGSGSAGALQQLAWYLHLSALWEQIQADFCAAGLKVVLLKGTQWASELYPDPSLRPCGDIDLLVHLDDLPAAAQRLTALGGIAADTPYLSRHSALQCHFHWVFTFAHLPNPVTVELHWRLHTPGAFDLPPWLLWQHVAQGPSGWRLGPELELFLACLHAFRHGFVPYRTLVDVDRVLTVRWDALTWDLFWALAAAARATALMGLILGLAAKQLGSPLPSDPLSRRHLSGWRVWLGTLPLASQRLLGRSARVKLRILWLHLVVGSLSAQASLLRRLFLPPRELIASVYGVDAADPWAMAWAYLWRPLRLVGKYLRSP